VKVKIEIDCDNAAFEGNWTGEVQAILEQAGNLLDTMGGCLDHTTLMDSNGNTVGKMEVTNE
jgi:hypothetical protein